MNLIKQSKFLKLLLIMFLMQQCNRFEEKQIAEKKIVYCSKDYQAYYFSLDDIKNYKPSGSILFNEEIIITGELIDSHDGTKEYYYKFKSKNVKNESYMSQRRNHNINEFVEVGKCDLLKFLVTSLNGIILRSSPSTKGEKLQTIPDGTELAISNIEVGEILEDKPGDWAKTTFDGKTGYVHTSYLNNISFDLISQKKYSYCDTCQDGPFFTLVIGNLKESSSINIDCKIPSVAGTPELGSLEGTIKKKEYDERGINLTINGNYTKTTFQKEVTMQDPIQKVISIKDFVIHFENEGSIAKPKLVLYTESKDTCIGLLTESTKDSFKIENL